MSSFKDQVPLPQRLRYSATIKKNYPSMIPAILYSNKRHIKFDKNKYMVPDNLLLSKFVCSIRKYANITEKDAIFLTVNNYSPNMNSTMGEIYNRYGDEDGFLYIAVSTENCFG